MFVSGTNIFQVLKDFKDALETNNVNSIQNAIDNINQALDKNETNIAHVGAYVNRIDTLLEDNESRNTQLTQTISDLTDIDVVQAVSDFNTLSTTYQAMLYSMARVQDLTIMNFLK